jgi:hypothetical protein
MKNIEVGRDIMHIDTGTVVVHDEDRTVIRFANDKEYALTDADLSNFGMVVRKSECYGDNKIVCVVAEDTDAPLCTFVYSVYGTVYGPGYKISIHEPDVPVPGGEVGWVRAGTEVFSTELLGPHDPYNDVWEIGIRFAFTHRDHRDDLRVWDMRVEVTE